MKKKVKRRVKAWALVRKGRPGLCNDHMSVAVYKHKAWATEHDENVVLVPCTIEYEVPK